MKRMLLIVMAILCLTLLTACLVIPQYKYFNIDPDTVYSIEIYDLRDCDCSGSSFLNTQLPAYQIPADKIDAFMSDLSEIRFGDDIIISLAATDPSFHYDEWTVRINYKDGTYELISCDGYGQTFDQNGEEIDSHHFGCDDRVWKVFISDYVPAHIFEAA